MKVKVRVKRPVLLMGEVRGVQIPGHNPCLLTKLAFLTLTLPVSSVIEKSLDEPS
jgi:hypothetical protein